jgi:hypothetical protein
MSRTSIEWKLARAQVAIDNALTEADLAAALATFGYDAARLRQGLALRETAQMLAERQSSEYGDLFTTQDAYVAARQQAHDTYMGFLKIARVAFEDDRGARQTLGLAERRHYDLAGWMRQAQQFYNGALINTNILSQLAAFGITPAALESGRQRVAAVIAANNIRRQRRGSALNATRQRDMAVAALESWMRDFLKVARVALKDRPQLLAQLGVATNTAHRGRQATAPATLAAPGDDLAAAPRSTEPDALAQPRTVRRNGRTKVGEQAG